MIGAGVAVLWLGYALAFWGATFLSGQEVGFFTVVVPGRWKPAK